MRHFARRAKYFEPQTPHANIEIVKQKSLIFIVVILCLVIWYSKHQSSQNKPTPSEVHAPQPKPISAAAKPQKTNPSGRDKRLTSHRITGESKPPSLVPFQIKDGYAVAHGDIILGVPEDPTIDQGFYQLPEPIFWNSPEIPYAIDADLPNPNRVEMALKHIEVKTGLHFVPHEEESDAIIFQAGKQHCLSTLGRQGGWQPISLANNCGWNEITHEILHSLGFIHEHSRFDRDSALQIFWEQIEEKYHPQFEALPESFLGPLKSFPFDYRSVMLYSDRVFAKTNDGTTMKSRTPEPIAPSSQGLSPNDVAKVKALFRLP